ncbi:hypothetical protein JVT61DRAFT_9603 [Boletus reticuloceps]|uniref:Uncharacterized protein n=1 Tax=Boletus reticuloceps TaxID=495285 RepID=A0A8I2YGG5_9AGAM|nr:hypothetical protein JVT61DRAFT_9603 [Boletus reticuloceps]
MDIDVDTVTAQSNFPAPDVPSECSDRSTTSQFIATPLCAQTSVSTVPATPNADIPPSFPIPKFESSTLSISTTCKNLAQHGVTLATMGMPFAGANCGARRPILSGSVSQVGPGTPFHNSYLVLTPGLPSANQNFDAPRKRPNDGLECFDDDKCIEFQQKEALLFLDIARARGNVWKLEQKLTQAKWDETNTTAKLYKIQAEEAERRSDVAEVRVGTICNSIRMTGGTLCDTSIQKCGRISEDSIQLGTGPASGSPEV